MSNDPAEIALLVGKDLAEIFGTQVDEYTQDVVDGEKLDLGKVDRDGVLTSLAEAAQIASFLWIVVPWAMAKFDELKSKEAVKLAFDRSFKLPEWLRLKPATIACIVERAVARLPGKG